MIASKQRTSTMVMKKNQTDMPNRGYCVKQTVEETPNTSIRLTSKAYSTGENNNNTTNQTINYGSMPIF